MKKSLCLTIILLHLLLDNARTTETADEHIHTQERADIHGELLIIKKEIKMLRKELMERSGAGGVTTEEEHALENLEGLVDREKDCQDEILLMKGRIKEKDRIIEELGQKAESLSKLQKETPEEVDELIQKVKQRDEEINMLILQNEELKGSLEQKNSIISELKEKEQTEDGIQAVLDDLRTKNSILKENLQEIEKAYSEADLKIESLSHINKELENDNKAMLAQLDKEQAEKQHLIEQRDNLTKQIQELSGNDNSEATIKELEIKLKKAEDSIFVMEKEKEKMIENVNETFKEASKINEELEKEVEEKESAIEVLYSELDHLRMTIDELNRSPVSPDMIKETKINLEICENDNMALVEKIKDLDHFLQQKEKDNRLLVQKLMELTKDRDTRSMRASRAQRSGLGSNLLQSKSLNRNNLSQLETELQRLRKRIAMQEDQNSNEQRYNAVISNRRTSRWRQSRSKRPANA